MTVLLGDLRIDNGLGEDFDPEGDSFYVSAVGGSAANVGDTVTLASGAQVQIDASLHFTFDPRGAFDWLQEGFSSADSITYTITDANGATSTALAVFSVTGVNDAPVAADDSGTAQEQGTSTPGSNATGNVLTGAGADTDVDDDESALTVAAVRTGTEAAGTGTAGTIGAGLVGLYGTLTLAADGSYTYVVDDAKPTVNALASGGQLVEHFTYTVTDPGGLTDTAQLSITINGADDNSGPTAVAQTIGTDEDNAVTGTLGATDPDAGDDIDYAIVSGSEVGGSVTSFDAETGAFTFTPDADFSGIASFSFTASDGTETSAPATVTIDVAPVNDEPTITGVNTGVVEQDAVGTEASLLFNGGFENAFFGPTSPIPGQLPEWTAAGETDFIYSDQPHSGSYGVRAAGFVTSGDPLTLSQEVATIDGEEYILSFWVAIEDPGSPNPNNYSVRWNGIELLTGVNAPSQPYTFYTFHVTGDADGTSTLEFDLNYDVNYFYLDDVALTAAGAGTTTGQLSVTDPDAGQSAFIEQAAHYGTYGTFAITAAGVWTYTADNTNPTVQALLDGEALTETFSVATADGTLTSVTVTILGTHEGPVASADTGSADENEILSFDVLANDTADIKTLIAIGTVAVASANSAIAGIDAAAAFSINSNQIMFDPAALFDALAQGDTATVTVAYTMQDSYGVTSSSNSDADRQWRQRRAADHHWNQ